ncbi:MAG: hypothetical protein QXZ36_03680 [Thermoproteota archaeon]
MAGELLPFRAGVRTVRIPMDSIPLTAFGQTGPRSRCRPAGYLHKIWLNLQGTIMTGSGTPSGGWLTYPFLPFSLLSKIRVFATPGTDLINISGDALAQLNYLMSYAGNVVGAPVSQFNNGLDASVYQTNSGAVAASTAYSFAASFEIPISTDDSLLWGLLPLQNEQTLVYVELTLAPAANIHNITGVSVTPNFTAYLEQEVFMVSNEAQVAVPNLQFAHKIIETPKAIPSAGDNIYEPLIGPVYLRHLVINENSSAQMANSSITQVRYRFAQQVYIVDETYSAHMLRNFAYLGVPLPRGVVYLDWTNGQGIEGIVDTRDMVNTSQQTNVQLVETITGSLTNAQMRVVDEYLSPL